MRRFRRLLLKLAIAALAILVLVEGSLWMFFSQGREPEIDVRYHQDFPGLKKEIRFRKNGLGLRSLTLDQAGKPSASMVRVLCVGASTTEQGTQDTEDMWMAHLERKLQKAYASRGVSIQVGAYAKGGAKMHEVVRWCGQNLERLEIDVVVTLFGINSVVTDAAYSKRHKFGDYRRYMAEPLGFTEKWLLGGSQIYRHVRTIRANAWQQAYLEKNGGLNFDIQGVAAFRQTYWRTPLDVGGSVPPAGETELFRQKSEYFARWLAARGIGHVVLGQPLLLHDDMDYREVEGRPILSHAETVQSPEAAARARSELEAIWFVVNSGDGLVRMSPGAFRRKMNRFNAVQKAVAETHGARYVPLDERIEPSLENFFDDCHFTDLGSQRVGAVVFPAVHEAIDERLEPRTDANFRE